MYYWNQPINPLQRLNMINIQISSLYDEQRQLTRMINSPQQAQQAEGGEEQEASVDEQQLSEEEQQGKHHPKIIY